MEFFDREQDCITLWKWFKADKNVLMLAPRRVGKTMLLHKLCSQAEESGFRAVVVDVQGYGEEKDFFQQLCSSIQEEIGTGQTLMAAFTRRLRQVINGDENLKDWRQLLLHTDWRQFAETLLETLNKPGDEKPLLIMVDELPIFILTLLKGGDRGRASSFMYWLRNMRQRYPMVRWLYTGSVGLDAVSRREEMEGALIDMEVYPLKPFSPQVARDYIQSLSGRDNCHLDDAALQVVIDGLGWLSPYYLEKIVNDACVRKSITGEVSAKAAQDALDAMLSLEKRVYWATWREHLTKNFLDPERTYLFLILSVIAANPAGARRDTILMALNRGGEQVSGQQLSTLLDTLVMDGYLISCEDDPGRFRFMMNLLRLWWLRYVVGTV